MEQPDNEGRIKELEKALSRANNTIASLRKEQEEFIRLAAHDLQAPVRKLSTFTQRLVQKFNQSSDVEVDNYTGRILATTEVMRTMIEQLSYMASLNEVGNLAGRCDLQQMINDISMAIWPGGNTLFLQGDLPVVEGNSSQLETLFSNIFANAEKFKHTERSLQVLVDCEKARGDREEQPELYEDKEYWKIVVSDNGIGIGEADAEKIFQPFVRLNGKSAYPGNGMGLAICKKILKNHGGIIYAESNSYGGSRFTIILPEKLK